MTFSILDFRLPIANGDLARARPCCRRQFSRWWRFLGPDLMNVIMPKEYYQVRCGDRLFFDELGWWHYQTDLQRFSELESVDDRIVHSRFLLYCAHGMMLFVNRVQATQYAMRRVGYYIREAPAIDPQRWLELEAAIDRKRESVSS
jgi:hypothetical protein